MNRDDEHALRFGRRPFLAGLLGAGLFGCGGGEESIRERWVSGVELGDGAFGIGVLTSPESTPRSIPTTFRGHGLAVHPISPSTVVFFARRPGELGVVVDVERGVVLGTFRVAPGRQMQGHGCFSGDGALLFASEADSTSGAGKIVVRETSTYAIVDELDTGGIGPHQIDLMPDQQTIVVANGGILELGGVKQNLDTMVSSLAYVDVLSRTIREKHSVPEPKASIRHMAITPDGVVALGIQVERAAAGHQNIVPLGATHRAGEDIRLLEEGLDFVQRLNDYVGAVAVCSAERVAGFTSPQGDVAAFWNVDSGAWIGQHAFADVCGIAPSNDGRHFLLSSSIGEVRTLRASDLMEVRTERRRSDTMHFDNHLVVTG